MQKLNFEFFNYLLTLKKKSIMKKAFSFLTIVCFVATLVTFTSCQKSQEDLIVGTWKCTSVTCVPENPFVNLLIGTTFTFNADNTFTLTQYNETNNGTYAIADSKLTFTIDEETGVMEISKLDKKNMVLVMRDSYEDYDDDGNPVTVENVITMNFDKQ